MVDILASPAVVDTLASPAVVDTRAWVQRRYRVVRQRWLTARMILPEPDFDATLGFPGEGPSPFDRPVGSSACQICTRIKHIDAYHNPATILCVFCFREVCHEHGDMWQATDPVQGWRAGACRWGPNTGRGPFDCCRPPLPRPAVSRSRSPRIALPDHGMNTARTDPDGGSDRYQPVCEPSAAPAGNDGSGSSWEVGPIAPEGYAEHPWAVDPETAIGRAGNRVVYYCQLCRMSTKMWPGHHVCTMRHLDRLARNSFQPGEEPPLVAYVERTPTRSS